MGKVTDLGLAKPDDPIFKEGLTVSSPITARLPLAKLKPKSAEDEKPEDDA